jgi:hypothetical protein
VVRRARTLACAALVACAGAAAAASPWIRIEPGTLTPAQVDATRLLVDAAHARLPPDFLAGLDVALSLRWREDLPADVHGRVRGGRIGLRRELLDDWMRDGDGDAHVAPPALAALLHELAHVHDRSAAGGASRDPRLLDLAGWPVRPLRLGQRVRGNDFRDRSPDAYERTSPAEFFAVNFEHFLLDPAYGCRRPGLHGYFATRFGWSPPRADCAPGLPFVAAGADEAVVQWRTLDPARVHAVEYLFAEADARPMSRWGHSMLRLVVCAPGRAPGPDCRFDLEHHLVLSFRAFVDDVQVSSWRGLTGAYPARLFVLPLQQVVDEYTLVELRGLQSLPLRLQADEIEGLLSRAAQVHWSYDGRYWFVTNNCAVETWKLLNDGVPRLAGAPLRSVTPSGLLRKLQRHGIADGSVLADRARAIREGHYFESQAEHHGLLFEVADATLGLPRSRVEDWLALDPAQRAPWLVAGDLRATAALLVLEQAAFRREEASARQELKQRFLRGRAAGPGADPAESLAGLLQDAAYAGRPAGLLAGDGYGLPQAEERGALAGVVAASDARLRSLRGVLEAEARALLRPQRRDRLQGIEDNLAALGRRMRALQPTTHP